MLFCTRLFCVTHVAASSNHCPPFLQSLRAASGVDEERREAGNRGQRAAGTIMPWEQGKDSIF